MGDAAAAVPRNASNRVRIFAVGDRCPVVSTLFAFLNVLDGGLVTAL